MTEPSDHLKRHYRTWGKPTKPPSPAAGVLLQFTFFLLVVFGLLLVLLASVDITDSPNVLAAATLTVRVIGGFIALLGASMVAVRTAHGDKLSSLAPWVVTALVGVFVLEPSWGVGIGLGAIVAAVIVKETVGDRADLEAGKGS